MSVAAPAEVRSLKDRELKQKLQDLRQTDNFTNWLYLGRAYLVIALSAGGAIAFHQWQMATGLSPWWNLPVALLAIITIGASQHQLAGATHEATHHILFKNRMLNELASDWLCMFPLFSSTYIFRQHHLAHHQFINDPQRDPDFSQLRISGHWLNFPVSKGRFLWTLLKQASLVPLVRYILVRARYNSLGADNNPYDDKDREKTFSPWPARAAVVYVFGYFTLMAIPSWFGDPFWLAMLPLACLAAMLGFLLSIPAEQYPVSRLRPVIAPRTTMISRAVFVTVLLAAIAWLQYLTGAPVCFYFFVLWLVPLFTSFAFFMILRQIVQHGNGDRGWLTNTRTFLVNPFIRYAVFPFGMDYHLPHHMFATIPHYRLPDLHNLLMSYPEYAERGIVVEGYFFPWQAEPGCNPTVLDVLGPAYTRRGEEVFIDDSVLESCEVDNQDKEAIRRNCQG
jgi:fatty acid desaturase